MLKEIVSLFEDGKRDLTQQIRNKVETEIHDGLTIKDFQFGAEFDMKTFFAKMSHRMEMTLEFDPRLIGVPEYYATNEDLFLSYVESDEHESEVNDRFLALLGSLERRPSGWTLRYNEQTKMAFVNISYQF